MSLASADMKNDIESMVLSIGLGTTTAPALEIPFPDGKFGRDFYLAWAPGEESATFKWLHPQSSDDLEIAHLSS